MACKTTSIRPSRAPEFMRILQTAPLARLRCRAWAVAEMMIAMGLGLAMIAVACGLMAYSFRSYTSMVNYVDLDRSSRIALDRMTSDIRQADKLTSYSTNQLVFQTTDPNSGATNTLTFSYSSVNKTLTRTFNGQSMVLL